MPTHESIVLDLPERYLDMVLAILRKHLPHAEVWAYGSRVSGGGHAASDLDLVVRQPGKLTEEMTGLSRLRGEFSESNLPIRVDLNDWARIPESFRQQILQSYVILQPGNGA